jgi:predicted RNase H-like nuclease (RuvC/YqgF family)
MTKEELQESIESLENDLESADAKIEDLENENERYAELIPNCDYLDMELKFKRMAKVIEIMTMEEVIELREKYNINDEL